MTQTASTREDWRTLVARKRKQLDAQIPSEWRLTEKFLATIPANGRLIEADVVRGSGILSEKELSITENYSATELLDELSKGAVSSVDVTTAFCKRAAIAQQLTSCLTEHFFQRAIERAEFLDEYLQREKKLFGPLHGLPISIKDSFCIEGVQSTVGYVKFLENSPASHNSAIVEMLLNLGAVLYVKTNIPQTMMTGDSENNIFGRALSPHNTNLTAGGSSGGEGALVAFRGSILGIGTDIAGSIRIPSLCCGVYGFKPSIDRIPWGGQVADIAMEGTPGLKPSAGPLAHSLNDIELFVSTIINAGPWKYDSTASAAPWSYPKTSADEPRQLTIGILPESKDFPLHPPVKRALQTAISALKNKGHRIVYLSETPGIDFAYANRLAFQYFIYGPHTDHIAASGEPPVTSVAKMSSPMFTGPFPVDMELPPFEKIDALHKARKAYAEAWRKTWVENNLDVLLAPGAQNTAVPHDTFGWPPYTVVWNLLDYPACIIPYGKASKELDPEPMAITDGVQPSYDPDAVDGAPCAIQVIAPRFQDEKCLSAARVIDEDIR
ncbi:fatty-acid amide hydrolase [Aspergillus costaricaensis CBS 115574]|uniref:Fatty-acid amide hydrolase n=1 Tax=Aspergillus costaricaensis CBS 115574 TaxID=1448317 RepID=A0ACD1IBL8_9EURO|nr:fatty-acid amide hydrolase [Aspergillus costaricaensis CBS 115574]RAK87162.1 fatty-acid amide hydrolase [Aspergillus costaricaensis CBS 115574]